MNTEKWLEKNTDSLAGKTVAVTGTTGGLGKVLCRQLAALKANLILLDRNAARSEAFREELIRSWDISVCCIPLELEDLSSVKKATDALEALAVDVFIHNAGAYSIPRRTCSTGLDNVFQINFASPYYMIRRLLPGLREREGRVVAVGSIAHNYSKIDLTDMDFSTRKAASKVYGNAKRHLMFSLYELFRREDRVTLSVVHPGITFTNITAHYPPWLFSIIKHPMKVIFMKPDKACLSLLKGVFSPCGHGEWIGPWLLNVWGRPCKRRLTTCSPAESLDIGERAERIYSEMASQQAL